MSVTTFQLLFIKHKTEIIVTVGNVIEEVNTLLNDFIWGPYMLAFFLLVGLMFTLRTGLFQIRQFSHWIDVTFLQIFKNRNVRKTQDNKTLSQFQSLCMALAATMGTGNIAGVSTAIVLGGPGAVFWMWVSAFLGMMTNFAEKALGIKYRYKNEEGFWVGGAMTYIEKGLGSKLLAFIYSAFCALASFGIGNMTQANSIAGGLKASFGIPEWVIAILVMFFAGIVILGGMKRVAGVTEKVVPFMAVFYLIGGLIVILVNADRVPGVIRLIIREAFGIRAAGSGVVGYGMMTAMRFGVSRGIFSNEAGLGSSVIAHSSSDVKEPVVQGMWGIFEVFADTIVVCTITAFVILTSGVYDVQACLESIAAGEQVVSGTVLTANAFQSVIPFGDKFIAVSVVLFAFATILGWSYYGQCAVEYLFGKKAVFAYKMVYIAMISPGCMVSLELVWGIADTLNGFMAIPNLVAITLLSGEVVEMTKRYLKDRKAGF